MNFTKNNLIDEFSDVKIILREVDDDEQLVLNLHKIILAHGSEYFYKLFLFNKTINTFTLIVDDVNIMKFVIYSLYNITIDLSHYPKWRSELGILKCRNYLLLNIDITKIYNLIIPPEGFILLLEIVSLFNFNNFPTQFNLLPITNFPRDNIKLIALIKKNLPIPITNIADSNIFKNYNDLLLRVTKIREIILLRSYQHELFLLDIETSEIIKSFTGKYIFYSKIIDNNTKIFIVYCLCIVLIDLKTMECIKSVFISLIGSPKYISEDNKILVASAINNDICNRTQIRLWDLDSLISGDCNKLIGEFNENGNIRNLIICVDNQFIAYTTNLFQIKIWNITTRKFINTILCTNSSHIHFTNDNQFLVHDKNIIFRYTLDPIQNIFVIDQQIAIAQAKDTHIINFSLDGTLFAYTTKCSPNIYIWDIIKKECIKILIGNIENIELFRFNHNCKFIISKDKSHIEIWDIMRGVLVNSFYELYNDIFDSKLLMYNEY